MFYKTFSSGLQCRLQKYFLLLHNFSLVMRKRKSNGIDEPKCLAFSHLDNLLIQSNITNTRIRLVLTISCISMGVERLFISRKNLNSYFAVNFFFSGIGSIDNLLLLVVNYQQISNSLIIHQVKIKKIVTVKEV